MAVSKLLCILGGFAALVGGATGHGHVRSNDVCFEDASSVSFMLTDKVITRGQPYDGIYQDSEERKDGNGGYFQVPCLKVRAGRHDSRTVARDFMSGLGRSNVLVNLLGRESSNGVPEKLNFYVEGTLGMNFALGSAYEVRVECPSIRLAQGGVRSAIFMLNPWWIGSRLCSGNGYSNSFVCFCSNGAQVKFSQHDGSDHLFNVELIRQPDTQWMQQDAVSDFGNGSAALVAAAAPRLALEGNSTNATATALPAGETTSNDDTIEPIFYP